MNQEILKVLSKKVFRNQEWHIRIVENTPGNPKPPHSQATSARQYKTEQVTPEKIWKEH